MFDWLKHRERSIAELHWQRALAHCVPARRLTAADKAELRDLATRFLKRKSIEPVQGLKLTEADRVLLATHACLPILKLGFDWYDGWHSVVVYPGLFVPQHEYRDAAGVVHRTSRVLSGEAWPRGPVIFSWDDVQQAGAVAGRNVVIHEMAHKLDMLNGEANGFPPLHGSMNQREWVRIFTHGWDHLHDNWSQGLEVSIDHYGLESPAEFFAVVSEQFFEQPAELQTHLPAVYEQLVQFYRQHPASNPL